MNERECSSLMGDDAEVTPTNNQLQHIGNHALHANSIEIAYS